MIYQTVAAALLVTSASASLFTPIESHQKYMWESFKQEWSRNYETMEAEMHHFQSFVANLKVADQRNALEASLNGTAIHGITKFSDLSQEEFSAKFLLSDASLRTGSAPVTEVVGEPSAVLGLVDWSGKLTTPVKDQGYCGSCWAFSATEQIESDLMRAGTTYILSPEQITQCDTTSKGCNGGWTENAYNYVKKAGGLELNSDYPYTSYQGTTGKCIYDSSKAKVTVSGYATVSGESAMASYVQSTGPLSVCLDASAWNSYQGGIVASCGKSVDHCVQAVGVDASSSGYWKVRNSWGTSWGESGYIRLAYGKNMCLIANDPTHATVSRK